MLRYTPGVPSRAITTPTAAPIPPAMSLKEDPDPESAAAARAGSHSQHGAVRATATTQTYTTRRRSHGRGLQVHNMEYPFDAIEQPPRRRHSPQRAAPVGAMESLPSQTRSSWARCGRMRAYRQGGCVGSPPCSPFEGVNRKGFPCPTYARPNRPAPPRRVAAHRSRPAKRA